MTAVTENIEYIDDAVNGIECIGDGKFTVTEERLRELLENEVIKNLYDMNVGAPGSCMFGIESLYPSYGNAPDIVADTLIDSVYRPTMELLIEISSDHKKSSSKKTKNPFRTSQMY